MQQKERTLLYIDMAYIADFVKKRNQHQFFYSRHSNGYFKKVWGVHPIADVGGTPHLHQIKLTRLTSQQLILEGVAELKRWPHFLLPLNFIYSQMLFIRIVARLVRKHDISVIAATDPLYGGLFGLALKRMCRKPLVVFLYMNLDEVHEDTGKVTMSRLIPWWWLEKKVTRFVLKNADLIAGGNKNNMEFGIHNGAPKEKSVVLPVSKNMHKDHLLAPEERTGIKEVFQKWQIPLHKKYLLYLGRHEPLKRPLDLLKAMKYVIENEPEVIGLMAGDGSMRSELELFVAQNGLQGKILFLGNVDQETLSKIIPSCITLSALTGMALIECGLGGSPIVAYDRDWQADFIDNGKDGFIVDYKDYKAMGEKALALLRDETLRKTFSKRIREKSLTYADSEKIYAHEHAVYDALFARTGLP